MLQNGWLLFALLTLGPLLGALLIERARIGRIASVAVMLALFGAGAAVILQLGRQPTIATMAAAGGGMGAGAAASNPGPAEAAADQAARLAELERQRLDGAALREQLATADNARKSALAAQANAESQLASLSTELATVRGHLSRVEASAGQSAKAPAAGLEAERQAHAAAEAEIKTLRARIQGLEAERTRAAAAAPTSSAVLDQQARMVAAQRAIDEQTAKLEAARQRMAGDLARLEAEQRADRAEITDLRAKLAAAQAMGSNPAPAPTAATATQGTGLPAPPPPFANMPSPEALAANAASPPAVTAGPMRDALAAGVTKPAFTLAALTLTELVQGRPGRYYRITCRDAGGKRLEFEPGGYNLTSGDGGITPCMTALNATVMAGLPKEAVRTLYIQGFASTQGFARPLPLPAGDGQLKSVPYLARGAGKQHFEAKARTQTIAAAYANKELPVLRAAYVADLVEQAGKGAPKPVVLEGEFKPNTDAAARSFDLILYVNW